MTQRKNRVLRMSDEEYAVTQAVSKKDGFKTPSKFLRAIIAKRAKTLKIDPSKLSIGTVEATDGE